MLLEPTIQSAPPSEPGLDHAKLHLLGLDRVRQLASSLWTDHNLHDPGITTLELLAYALTDIGYRASWPIEDLVASSSGSLAAMKASFTTPRQVLPNRPLTPLDYRKLMIDVKGVKNAWVEAVPATLYADPAAGTLSRPPPAKATLKEVTVRGLHRALVDIAEDAADPAAVIANVKARLQANRCLCEDFTDVVPVPSEDFALCAELELAPDADVVEVQAQILIRVQAYLAPGVLNHTLAEMLARGLPVDEIFAGPALDFGFIDDEELEATEIRTEIRLADVIRIVMEVPGVLAVRDMLVTPAGAKTPLADKWVVAVDAGKRPTLAQHKLITYKRGLLVQPLDADVEARRKALAAAGPKKNEDPRKEDLPFPTATVRDTGRYVSFQGHFPAIYGLGADGLPSGADTKRQALAYQLKAYLLHFDQVLADDCRQLLHVQDLLSIDPAKTATYFHQPIDSFAAWDSIYARSDKGDGPTTSANVAGLLDGTKVDGIVGPEVDVERRNRFLDHLVARYAERFHEYVAVTSASLGTTAKDQIAVKCGFLASYPTISAERGLAYDRSLTGAGDLWDTTTNVSGLEKRLAKLLGMPDAKRHDLAGGTPVEGLFLIENILLRTGDFDDPLLPICADPGCADCAGMDPYSYRMHVILPAYAGRFTNMDFRRFAEEVIREESPAHVMPKICWLDEPTMTEVQNAYHAWLSARASGPPATEKAALTTLLDTLYQARSVYPKGWLHDCVAGDTRPKFVIGRTRLGTEESDGR